MDTTADYKTTPAGDRIMDFSHAGYMGGGVALPVVAVRRTLKPSGGDDDSAAIQAVINEVAATALANGFRGLRLCRQPFRLAEQCDKRLVAKPRGLATLTQAESLRQSGGHASGKFLTKQMTQGVRSDKNSY